MNLRRKVVFSLALVLATAAAKADPVVYISTGGEQFGTIDLSTGSFTPIGPGIPIGTGGLVQGPGGNLLTLGFNGNLYSINPTTGLTTNIGATGLGDCSLPTSPCGPNSTNILGKLGSTIYATDLANNLYSINPATGAATLIGLTGIPSLPFVPLAPVPGDPDGSFYTYDEILFDYSGNLYANFDAGYFDPVTFTPTQLIAPQIYEINTSTGLATPITPTIYGLEGITNVNGTVYGFNLNLGTVVTLNLADGSTSYVSDFDPTIGIVTSATTFTPVPEPATLSMVGTGLAAIAAAIKHRRSRPS